MKQKEKSNNAEPSNEQNEELDVVEAFKTCHTSSKHGQTKPVKEAIVSPKIFRKINNLVGHVDGHVLPYCKLPALMCISQLSATFCCACTATNCG